MVGPLIYGFSEDAVAAAKVIADFAKSNDKLIVKGGAYAGKALDANGVQGAGRDPEQGSAAGAAARPDAVADLAPGAACWRPWPRSKAQALPRRRPKPPAAA